MFSDELEELGALSRDEAMQSIRKKLSDPDEKRQSIWWEGMSYIERLGIISCSNIFVTPISKKIEIRKLACAEWVDVCGSHRVKLMDAVKRISSRAKSHGVCHV